MKTISGLWIFLVVATASGAQAQISEVIDSSTSEYIYSQGQASSFCTGGPASYFCYDQIKRQAKDNAVRDASFRCSMKKGRIDEFSASCTDFCSPFSLPDQQQQQYVSCNLNCSVRCEIPDAIDSEDNY